MTHCADNQLEGVGGGVCIQRPFVRFQYISGSGCKCPGLEIILEVEVLSS